MRTALEVIKLEPLGIVRMRGADAVKFLQGQLSNDVARLSAQHSLLAGYHNPQGRTIAVVRLMHWDADDILAVVPRELAAGVASRLSKFVLRAKVKIVDESAAWRVSGLVGAATVATVPGVGGLGDAATAGAGAGLTRGDAAASATAAGAVASGAQGELALLELSASVGAQTRRDGALFACVGDQPPRWLVISPADAPSPVLDHSVGNLETWQRLDVAAGQPQVYAATSEQFVAQMLNLDALSAIAFDKGCYTGQEVIARAHYRGRVKRRMQRFISREACQLSPGDSGQLADGRTFKVVQAARLADGRCDFLAVAPLVDAVSEPGDANSKLASGSAAESGAPAGPGGASAESDPGATAAGVTTRAVHPALSADPAVLPYPLPD
jgi:tRNA-modifying protein YgfZ